MTKYSKDREVRTISCYTLPSSFIQNFEFFVLTSSSLHLLGMLRLVEDFVFILLLAYFYPIFDLFYPIVTLNLSYSTHSRFYVMVFM